MVTNVSHYADPAEPTGLWLSELTHAYDIAEASGYEQQIVSPKSGKSPLVWLPGKIPSRPKPPPGRSSPCWDDEQESNRRDENEADFRRTLALAASAAAARPPGVRRPDAAERLAGMSRLTNQQAMQMTGTTPARQIKPG